MTDLDLQPQEYNNRPQEVPHSRESEEAVLGAILINPEAYYDVAQFLKPEDFYIHRNKWIWEAMVNLFEQRVPLDMLTIAEELERTGYITELGGPAYLTSLINNVPTSMHAEAYGREVEQTAIRRRMIEAANKIVKAAYKEELAIDTVIDEAEKAVFGVSEQRQSADLQPIKRVIRDYQQRVEVISQQSDVMQGVPTHFKFLDEKLGGLQPSDLLIIAGRPGQGKTSFMLTIAKNAARISKKHIAIFSMEMSNEQVVQRLMSQETGIDSQRLRLGKLKDNEWSLFNEAIEKFSDTQIFLDDSPGITPTQIRAKCRRLHLEHRIDLVIIDYLQLMSGDNRNENRVQEVSYISRNLKALARELNVPVLAASQLSRSIEQRADHRPILSDLRESGSLEQDADIVMFLYRENKDNPEDPMKNVTEILIAKHRNGPTGSIQLVFREHLAEFATAQLPINR
jgi:replicative DNA helicase